MADVADMAAASPGSSRVSVTPPMPESGIQCGTSTSGISAENARRAQMHEDFLRTYKLLISGGVAGAVSRTVTAPIDRLKMLLQVQDGAGNMTLRQGLAKMASEGSIKAYFKGNGSNVVKIAPETAIKLTLNDSLKHVVARDPDNITVGERMFAGGVSGAVAQALLYPLDTIRTRLAVSPDGRYWGILHAAYRIRRDEGAAAFYRGIVPSMCGILPYAGVDIAIFEILKEWLLDRYDGQPPPSLGILVAGMLSSSIAQFVSYPLALIRTRMQAQGAGVMNYQYTGMYDVFQKTYSREGVRGLYKGLLPNLIKLAPAAGIGWYLFEETKLWLGLPPRS